MGLYTKLPEDLQEVDVIIAGGTPRELLILDLDLQHITNTSSQGGLLDV